MTRETDTQKPQAKGVGALLPAGWPHSAAIWTSLTERVN